MSIKHSIAQKLRATFPDAMLYRDMKAYHHAELKKLKEYAAMSEDEIVAKITSQYEEKTGHKLNLDNPKRFTEKIQWRKAYDRDPVYSQLSDKYAVREWVAKKIGEEHLIPLLGVWEKFDDIDFSKLPDRFVLKTNNGCSSNLIVESKAKINKCIARENFNFWLRSPYGYYCSEHHYDSIAPKIIAEQYMIQPGDTDLTDYKFFCFHGEPYYCQVISNRRDDECIDFYDMRWVHQTYHFNSFGNIASGIPNPQCLTEMISLSKKLSEGFEFTRVDFYEINAKVYFGEMTFTPASGYNVFDPDDWDYKLGELWDIAKPQVDYEKVFSYCNT